MRVLLKVSVNAPCPCGSKKKYKKCCKIFHNGASAPTALLLMKSRFSAFAVGDATYIMKTTHNENQDYTTDTAAWKSSILEFCNSTVFKQLTIVETQEEKSESYVTFKAILLQHNHDASFIEKSRFLKEEGKWYYHSGVFIDE